MAPLLSPFPKSSGVGGNAGPAGKLALGDGGGSTNAPGSRLAGAPRVESLPSGGKTTNSVSKAGTTFWGEASEILGFFFTCPAVLVGKCADLEDPALAFALNFAGDLRGDAGFFATRKVLGASDLP